MKRLLTLALLWLAALASWPANAQTAQTKIVDLWRGFVICTSPTCGWKGRTYDKGTYFGEQECLFKMRDLAKMMHVENQEDYAYGCVQDNYEPKQVKP